MSVVDRLRESEQLGRAIDDAQRLARMALSYTLEHAPIFGRVARRQRARVVLAPYKRTNSINRLIWIALAVPLIVFGCFLYGFFFGLTAPWLMVPFAIPIAVLTAIVIWALPDGGTAPTTPIEFLMPAFFIFMLVWPEYLAISLPGMPWITMMRLVGLPMAACFLISLSTSKVFRTRLAESLSAIKPTALFVLGFVLCQILTVFVSKHMFSSLQQVVNYQVYWTLIYVISCVLFRDIRYVERYWALLCLLAVPVILETLYEWHGQHVPWAGHIPKILQVPDPSGSVANTLRSSFRPGTHAYRAKGPYAQQLVLAEYLSLLTPFLLHFGMSKIRLIWRMAAFAMIPACFIAIRCADSRLGVVGMFVSLLLYGVVWSVVRWRSNPRDLVAAAIMCGYPAVFMAGLSLTVVSHRLNTMLFGGHAQQSSTDARHDQLNMALTALGHAPWGNGAGQCGAAMNYADANAITIDNYFITVSLDYGVLGAACWYGMFIAAIVTALRYCTSPVYGAYRESRLLAPMVVALTAFLIVKWAHGQDDIHSIQFMMLGMMSALVYRIRATARVATAVPQARKTEGARAPRFSPGLVVTRV